MTENNNEFKITLPEIKRLMQIALAFQVFFGLIHWYLTSIVFFFAILVLLLAVEKDLCFLCEDTAKISITKGVNTGLEAFKKRFGKNKAVQPQSKRASEDITKDNLVSESPVDGSKVPGNDGTDKNRTGGSNSVIYQPNNNSSGNSSNNISVIKN